MVLKYRHFVNLHKLTTPFVILALMQYYDNYTVGPAIYFGIHTGYCICWLLKDLFIHPDHSLEEEVTHAQFVVLFMVLNTYWLIPYVLISSKVVPSITTIMVSIPICLLGFYMVFGADGQRFFTLKCRPGLITTGFFTRTRNPNYFGETVLYLGWSLLAESAIPLLVVFAMALGVFYPRMVKKDVSLARHEEFAKYKAESNFFFPKLF